jgi:hypothetical protein
LIDSNSSGRRKKHHQPFFKEGTMSTLHLGSEGCGTDGINGYVGIGTTSPASKLHISAGDIQIDQGQRVYLHGGGPDTNWSIGKDTNHNINVRGASSGTRAFQVCDAVSGEAVRLHVEFNGLVGINCTDPQVKLDVNDNSIRIRTSKTPTASTATGTQGPIAWDSNYLYVCVTTNGWRRVALSSW